MIVLCLNNMQELGTLLVYRHVTSCHQTLTCVFISTGCVCVCVCVCVVCVCVRVHVHVFVYMNVWCRVKP